MEDDVKTVKRRSDAGDLELFFLLQECYRYTTVFKWRRFLENTKKASKAPLVARRKGLGFTKTSFHQTIQLKLRGKVLFTLNSIKKFY